MKIIIKLLTFFIVLILISCDSKNNDREVNETVVIEEISTPAEITLYKRLGGADGISSIVDDIITAHLNNPIAGVQFAYLNDDPARLELVKKHIREFLGAGTGGSETYTGKDMPSAHAGMNISEKQFLAVVDDVLQVLASHNMTDQTKKDMLYILYSFKGQLIVN